MILIGMFDSPFVRRVAVSMKLLGVSFEHRNWSVGKDADEIKKYNPLGRVPTLVLDGGEALIESSAILDHLDERAGPDKALLPAYGDQRRHALKLLALTTGVVDKGIQAVYERVFRPEEKRHQPWLDRCNGQMHGALRELEMLAAETRTAWLMGGRMMQPDITLACVLTYLREAASLDLGSYPTLRERVTRCEALPVFREFYAPFFTPQPKS